MTDSVTEFIVDMSCGNCQKKVNAALVDVPGVKQVDIDLATKRVVVTGSAHTATLIDAVKTTGKSVAVAGKSSVAAVCAEQPSDFLSAVAQFTQSAVKGLVRFTDLPRQRTLVEIDFDGLKPNASHAVGVHRSGDVTESGALGTIVADANGRARLQVEASQMSVGDIVGRSVVLRSGDAAAAERVACAVVARSAGAQQNDKRLCLCDGTTIWESKATSSSK